MPSSSSIWLSGPVIQGYHFAFNSLQSDTERSEHSGLMNLMKERFGTFRNITAHSPKVSWNMTEDALDLLI
jgi:hypothetical protein